MDSHVFCRTSVEYPLNTKADADGSGSVSRVEFYDMLRDSSMCITVLLPLPVKMRCVDASRGHRIRKSPVMIFSVYGCVFFIDFRSFK